jgi:hypothetical protein
VPVYDSPAIDTGLRVCQAWEHSINPTLLFYNPKAVRSPLKRVGAPSAGESLDVFAVHFGPFRIAAIRNTLRIANLLRLLLDVNAQLVAVLLLDLLVAELFGLVHIAIELCNETVSPTLRQRAFFLGLVLPEQLPAIFQRV